MVSVVTTVFNGEKFIARAIQSVLKQTYPNKEHIIVDGGSTDRTLDILGSYSDGFMFWISEPDEGIFDGINKGIVLSRGRYVKLLNSDDILPPDSISRAVQTLEGSSGLKAVKGNVEMIDSEDQTLEIVSEGQLHASWLLPREVYELAGLYRIDCQVSADYEFFLRLESLGIRFTHLDKVLARFRLGGRSAGYLGVLEGFKINSTYRSRRFAVSAALKITLKKTRYWLLRLLLGEKWALALSRQVKRRLRADFDDGSRVPR